MIYTVSPDGATIEFMQPPATALGSLIPQGEGPLPTPSRHSHA